MDKFSELKAAAAKYSAALNAHRENPTDKAALYAWDDAGSELDRAINHKEMEIIIALLAELEAKDKSIAELEAIRADASQVFKEIGNELGCNPDNESIMMAIDALKERERRVVALAGGNAELWETLATRLEAAEKRLATPVRLHRGALMVSAYAANSFNSEWHLCLARDSVVGAIRAAGFTVEGDE